MTRPASGESIHDQAIVRATECPPRITIRRAPSEVLPLLTDVSCGCLASAVSQVDGLGGGRVHLPHVADQ